MAIKRPKLLTNYPERPLDCQEALEGEFQAFVDKASAAGWAQREIFDAVKELAVAGQAADDENLRTSHAVADAIRRVRAFSD